METQIIANLLGHADSESSKFAIRKWHLINHQNNTHVINYQNITATGDANTRVAFRSFTPFTKCTTQINNRHVDNADNLNIIMSMYYLIQYIYFIENYSDTSRCLWQFKRDEQNVTTWNPANVTKDDSTSFKYKSFFIKPLTADNNGVFKNGKRAVLLKYLTNFWRALEMQLIHCKTHLKIKLE